MNFEDKLKRIEKRERFQTKWLKEKFPQIFQEQRHLDEGSIERYYWHYGYVMASRDILNLLRRKNDV